MAKSYVRFNFNISDEDYTKLQLLIKHYNKEGNKKYTASDLLRMFINNEWNNSDLKDKIKIEE